MLKPNILFIFSDQHRKFDLGCYGHEFVKTPHIDTLAAEGLRFNHCISNSPVCVPARGTLLTGLFATRHGALVNDLKINSDCESVADVLNHQGYHTGYIGKWHLGGIPRDKAIPKSERLGFKTWKVANCNHDYLNTYYYDEDNTRHDVAGYEPEIFGSLANDFIIENCDNQWALFLSLATPHGPFDSIPDEYYHMYEDDEIKLRPNTIESVKSFDGNIIPIEEYIKSVKGYFGHVSAVDRQVGSLIESLKESGQYENTIIIYTSDHGDMLGSQGERDKQTPYEESIAIPLIAFWKDKIYSGVCDELIGLVDLPVSIAMLVGSNFTTLTDGVDLSHLFTEPKSKSYDHAYIYDYYPAHQAEQKGKKAWRGIRTRRYTYAVHIDDSNWILYDNKTDPYQLNNLADEPGFLKLQSILHDVLISYVNKYDKFIDGIDFIRYFKKTDEFNASQQHFGMSARV